MLLIISLFFNDVTLNSSITLYNLNFDTIVTVDIIYQYIFIIIIILQEEQLHNPCGFMSNYLNYYYKETLILKNIIEKVKKKKIK